MAVNPNGGSIDFDSENCRQTGATSDVISCSCDHLTSFAILMSPDTNYQVRYALRLDSKNRSVLFLVLRGDGDIHLRRTEHLNSQFNHCVTDIHVCKVCLFVCLQGVTTMICCYCCCCCCSDSRCRCRYSSYTTISWFQFCFQRLCLLLLFVVVASCCWCCK